MADDLLFGECADLVRAMNATIDWQAELDAHERALDADCVPLAGAFLDQASRCLSRYQKAAEAHGMHWYAEIHLMEAISHLRAAGRHDLAERLEEAWGDAEVEAVAGELSHV